MMTLDEMKTLTKTEINRIKKMSLNESQKKWIDSVALWLKQQVEDGVKSEIELRFGTFLNVSESNLVTKKQLGTFVAGVNVNAWKRVQSMFAVADPCVFSRAPQSELEIVSIFDEEGVMVRHVEHADGSVSREKKLFVCEKNFVFRDPITLQLVCARLSHHKEIPLTDNVSQVPSLVRVRARNSFWHRMWRIDLSMIQQGIDNEAALRAPTIFEIEVELLHHLVDWTRYDFHYLASALFLKIQEITEAMLDADVESTAKKSFLNIVYMDE